MRGAQFTGAESPGFQMQQSHICKKVFLFLYPISTTFQLDLCISEADVKAFFPRAKMQPAKPSTFIISSVQGDSKGAIDAHHVPLL